MNTARIDPRVIREAAVWLMRLREPNAAPSVREAWQRWINESIEHQLAWQRADRLTRKFDDLPSGSASALSVPSSAGRRKMMVKALSVMLVGAPTAWLASQLPWDDWSADFRTGIGEQRRIRLADGSNVTMNTATTLDVAYSQDRRVITLHSGEILVDASMAASPFIVRTRNGSIRSHGKRFDAGIGDAGTHVAALSGELDITAKDSPTTRGVLREGQQTTFTNTSIALPQLADDTIALWTQGILFADNMRLAEFLAELSRYRRGVIRCDPVVANLRVSGSFQLDDTDRALQLLADTFPISVSMLTPYWVMVGPKQTT